ncbi:acyl-CoA dehydrogenase family protein [Winogradskya consettensis]|uniref:Acyl-CoA dehydrogenase n=1 Tax=Winogradskya consettensis TaxID=113560 RepID=A0A919T135_9ACTN|nr:acyl-CoA dehydrogenase family protein [Actinoplanes consettensis]GIM82474.1 acyl-CoA dehydrogenase [Actinoplanes consettensis]
MTHQRPTREQMIERATGIVPLLQKYSTWSEENRRVHDEVIDAMSEVGIFRMRAPARHGGYECDTRTLADVAATLASGDASAAWVASVHWIPTWMASMFPAEVREEVFATEDVRICGTLSPTAMAAPAPGGIVVNGKWSFITGALHSQWQEIIAVLVGPEGDPMPVVALVPMSELHIVDDWHTAGLRGTGSVSTVAQDLFVPDARFLPLGVVMQGRSSRPKGVYGSIYEAPLLPVASASSVGTAVGLARAAYEAFMERVGGRKITYTDYAHQAEAPLTHLQVADAAMKIDEAGFHADRLTATVDAKSAAGADWSIQERARARADMGSAVRLALRAVDVLADASGGTSNLLDVPIQRIRRDVQAVSLHALMHPDTNAELYGRVLCGQPPNSQYV